MGVFLKGIVVISMIFIAFSSWAEDGSQRVVKLKCYSEQHLSGKYLSDDFGINGNIFVIGKVVHTKAIQVSGPEKTNCFALRMAGSEAIRDCRKQERKLEKDREYRYEYSAGPDLALTCSDGYFQILEENSEEHIQLIGNIKAPN